MTHNIPDDIKHYFSEEFITAIAHNMDEPIPAISRAISAIIPTSLEALADQPAASGNFYQLAKEAAQYYPRVPDVAKLVNEEKGSNLHRDIFGNNERAVGRHIAAYSEVRPTTAFSLIMLVLPVMMGKIGENIIGSNTSQSDFSRLISGFSQDIHRLTPAGYTLPDLTHDVPTSKEDLEKIHDANILRNKSNFVFPKWVPVLIVAIVLLLLIYFSRL
jgi:hypothetical protein